MKQKLYTASLVALIGIVGNSLVAKAASFDLNDGNSQITVNDRNGVTVWYVDGSPDNLFISNYYYRIGETGGEKVFLEGIDGTPTVNQPQSNQLQLTYSGNDLEAEVNYSLIGGTPGSNQSLLKKSVTLRNLSSSPIDLHLFDYNDFDIKFNQLNQRDQAIALSPAEIILNSATVPLSIRTRVNPDPDRYEINDFFSLYQRFFLGQGSPITLTNTPPLNVPFPEPPSDNAFAFQWDFTLPQGESLTFETSANYSPIPEPSTIVASIALSLGGLRLRWRR